MNSVPPDPSPGDSESWSFHGDQGGAEPMADQKSAYRRSTSSESAGKHPVSKFWWALAGVLLAALVAFCFFFYTLYFRELPAARQTLREFFACMARDDLQGASALNTVRPPGELTVEYLRRLRQGPHRQFFQQTPEMDVGWSDVDFQFRSGHLGGVLRLLGTLKLPEGTSGYCHAVLLKREDQWRICQLSLFSGAALPDENPRFHDAVRITATLQGLCKALGGPQSPLVPLFLASRDSELPLRFQPVTAEQLLAVGAQIKGPAVREVKLQQLRFRRHRIRRRHRDRDEPRYRYVDEATVTGTVELEGGQRRRFRARLIDQSKFWNVVELQLLD